MGGWREWPARRELAKVATSVMEAGMAVMGSMDGGVVVAVKVATGVAALAVEAGGAGIVMKAGMAVMGSMGGVVAVAVRVTPGVMAVRAVIAVMAVQVTVQAVRSPWTW